MKLAALQNRPLLSHIYFIRSSLILAFVISGLLHNVFARVGFGLAAYAQSVEQTSIARPDFSVEDLTARIATLGQMSELSAEEKTRGQELYDTAIQAMIEASIYLETTTRLRREQENAPSTIEDLRVQMKRAQAASTDNTLSSSKDSQDDITQEGLTRMESALIARESDMRNRRAELDRYESELQTLSQRPIREELTGARERLAAISSDLAGLNDTSDDAIERAHVAALRARYYYRLTQIQTFEQEISGQTIRQQILTLRRDLASLQAAQAEQDVINLQNLTGQRRVSDAQTIITDMQRALSVLEKTHPFLQDFAAENLFLSKQLSSIARLASTYPRLEADYRSRRDEISDALSVAEQLTELGRINRQSSEMLRRLRTQRPPLRTIKSEMERNRRNLLTGTQTRLWAQERLRQMPPVMRDSAKLMSDWVKAHPDSDKLDKISRSELSALYSIRRELMLEMSDAAFAQISDADNLKTILEENYSLAQSLSAILDQKLLWLPSMNPISLKWPEKVLRGAIKQFNFDRFSKFLFILKTQMQSMWYITIFFALLIVLIMYYRPQLRREINDISSNVGRVRKDNYWFTPQTILATAIIGLPLPLVFYLIGILFQSSYNPDTLVTAVAASSFFMAGTVWFLLAWREWNRDGSLFDTHYKMSGVLRGKVFRQLNWFIPFFIIVVGTILLSRNARDPDIYEGSSLLAFCIFTIGFAIFAYRIIWTSHKGRGGVRFEQSLTWRYRKVLSLVFIVLPVFATILALSGYYYTGREIAVRMTDTIRLLILAYVAYGLIRRTLIVARRRLALNQAVERREKMLQARKEKEAAEEQGFTPPPLNYDEIDVETISRQSAQLLNAFVIIGLAIALIMTWGDMVPALSKFDNVTLWTHKVSGIDGDVIDRVTLWNLIQSVTIIVMTFIAAKNLPGFLEVFVLNRAGFDAGTRYAIVSIAGYVIVAIGVVIAFDRLGMDWSQLQWVFAALGVGIGFGLQEIIANFISGLIILFERPVRIGDYVTIGDQSGTVNRIQIRATTLTDLDNREILIPNKALITERVTNWTLSNAITRLVVHLGIAYGSDTEKARKIMLDTVQENPKALSVPTPQVLFLGFGDSSLDFEIRVYLENFEDRATVKHELHMAVNKNLAAADITIPFPQRDLHIVSAKTVSSPSALDDTVPTILKHNLSKTKKAGVKKKATSTNSATKKPSVKKAAGQKQAVAKSSSSRHGKSPWPKIDPSTTS